MNGQHLNDDELNGALIGEELPAGAAEHLAGCLVCRRRRDEFLALVETARGADPGEAVRERVREAALAAWGVPRRRQWIGWVAAAAAVLVLGVLPFLHRAAPERPSVNTDAVLLEVNQVLDRDPLAAMASEDVVQTVVPTGEVVTAERSVS